MGALGPAIHFTASHGADGCQRRGTSEAVAMQVFGSLFGRNGNAGMAKWLSRPIFASVCFARAVTAHWGNLNNPRVHLCNFVHQNGADPVNPGGNFPHQN